MSKLHDAARNGDTNEIWNLVTYNAFNVNEGDVYGYTPLHWAVYGHKKEAIRTLHRLGANLEAKENFGYTPLHIAARDGDESCVITLFELGAKDDVKNSKGQTPLDVARDEGGRTALVAKWNGIKAKIEVCRFLVDKVRLREEEANVYYSKFDEFGYDSMDRLVSLSYKDVFPSIIPKMGHAKDFIKKIDELKAPPPSSSALSSFSHYPLSMESLSIYSSKLEVKRGYKALCVGTNVFDLFPTLPSCINDANSVSDLLKKAGFSVATKHNLKIKDCRNAISALITEMEEGDNVVVYLSSHGAQCSNDNYIACTDSSSAKTMINVQAEIKDPLIRAGANLVVIILDACRDDLSIEKSIGGKKSIKSLFPPGANLVPSKGGVFSKSSIPDSREDSEHGEQVIMAFPVDSHTSALAGSVLSLYTEILIKYLTKPIPIDDVFKKVTLDCRNSKTHPQNPYLYTSVTKTNLLLVPK